MSADPLDVPGDRERKPLAPLDSEKALSDKATAVAIISVTFLLLIGMRLLLGDSTEAPLAVLVARRVYLVPIALAAWMFGWRGGLAVSALAVVSLLTQYSSGDISGSVAGIDYIDSAGYVIAGLCVGVVRARYDRRIREMLEGTVSLREAKDRLEERTIRLVGAQEYTTLILRSITTAVITVGTDGTVTTANPAAERLLGIPDVQMVGRRMGALLRDAQGLDKDVIRALEGRIPSASRDVNLVALDGREVHARISVTRMRASAGNVIGVVIALEDVSALKDLTDQLVRADRLASMGELTAGVAHEVRNPLGVIRASVQLLEDAKCDESRIHDAVSVIKQEIDRLDGVIKALLDFGRPSAPAFGAVDVDAVIADVVRFTERFAQQAGVMISVHIAEDLPRVKADADQLKQVFLNLMTNAVQAMDERGGHIRISVDRDRDYMVVRVADDGPGIDVDDLDKVFDPFFTKRDEGTGLGLTIVHRIIDQHEGRVEVRSSDEGTTFTVRLPVFDEREERVR